MGRGRKNALARHLQTRGFDCRHVLEVGLAEASDAEVCRYADEQGRIIISKDEDFLHLANRPEAATRVLWIRLGNCSETPNQRSLQSQHGKFVGRSLVNPTESAFRSIEESRGCPVPDTHEQRRWVERHSSGFDSSGK
jgi:predicted nuclease of predicted toxin-antitoxin system